MLDKENIKKASRKSFVDLFHSIPILLGGVMLFTLFNAIFPDIAYGDLFQNNILQDSITGGAMGSILSGESLTSYILGREFLDKGVGLVAVTAFLITWVSVAFMQIPFEVVYFGKRAAILRNVIAYIFALIVSIITVYVL